MKGNKHLLLLFILVFVCSCLKSPTKIENDTEISGIEKSSCTNLNLTSDIFSYKNTLALFSCVGWDKNFPAIHNAIRHVDEKKWNHLFWPINHTLFSSPFEKQEFANLLYSIDKLDGFTEIEAASNKLLKSEVFSSIYTVLNPALSGENFWKLEASEVDVLLGAVKVLERKRAKELFIPFLKKIRDSSLEDENRRLSFVRKLAKAPDHRRWEISHFLQTFFLTKGDRYPRFYELLREEQDLEKKIRLLTIYSDPNIQNVFNGIAEVSRGPQYCISDDGRGVVLDISSKMGEITKDLRESTWESFLERSIDKVYQASFSINMCPSIRKVFEKDQNRLEDSLLSIINLLKDPWMYQMISHHANSSKGIENGVLDYYQSVVGLVSTSMATMVQGFLQEYPAEARNALSFLSSLSLEEYLDISNAIILLFDQRSDILKSFDKLNENEQRALIRTTAVLFASESNILSSRYFLEKAKEKHAVVWNHLWFGASNKILTATSIRDLSFQLLDKEVDQELGRFFKRDQFFVLAKLLSQGASGPISWSQTEDVRQEEIVFQRMKGPGSAGECLRFLVENKIDLKVIEEGKSLFSCVGVETPSLLVIKKISETNKEYQERYHKPFFDHDSSWSTSMRIQILAIVKSIGASNIIKVWRNIEAELMKSGTISIRNVIESLFSEIENLKKALPTSLKETIRFLTEVKPFYEMSKILSSSIKIFTKESLVDDKSLYGKVGSCFKSSVDFSCRSATDLRQFLVGAIKILVDPERTERPFQLMKVMSDGIRGGRLPDFSNQQAKYHLQFKNLVMMLYDLSDKKEANNNLNFILNVKDKNGSWVTTNLQMTTMERIEKIISSVGFDGNYLGAHFQNAIAKSKNYTESVRSKKSLLINCSKVGYCGHLLGKDEKMMARNAITVFDGLLDAEVLWKHGNMLKTIMGIIVHASSEDSRSDLLSNKTIWGVAVPWVLSKEELKWHQGRFLTMLSEVNFFSTIGGWLFESFESREELVNFLNSKRGVEIVTSLEQLISADLEREELTRFMTNFINQTESQESFFKLLLGLNDIERYQMMNTVLNVNVALVDVGSKKPFYDRMLSVLELPILNINSSTRGNLVKELLKISYKKSDLKDLFIHLRELLISYDNGYLKDGPLTAIYNYYQRNENFNRLTEILNLMTKYFSEDWLKGNRPMVEALKNIGVEVESVRSADNPIRLVMRKSSEEGDLFNAILFLNTTNSVGKKRILDLFDWLFVEEGKSLSEFIRESLQSVDIINKMGHSPEAQPHL